MVPVLSEDRIGEVREALDGLVTFLDVAPLDHRSRLQRGGASPDAPPISALRSNPPGSKRT